MVGGAEVVEFLDGFPPSCTAVFCCVCIGRAVERAVLSSFLQILHVSKSQKMDDIRAGVRGEEAKRETSLPAEVAGHNLRRQSIQSQFANLPWATFVPFARACGVGSPAVVRTAPRFRASGVAGFRAADRRFASSRIHSAAAVARKQSAPSKTSVRPSARPRPSFPRFPRWERRSERTNGAGTPRRTVADRSA